MVNGVAYVISSGLISIKFSISGYGLKNDSYILELKNVIPELNGYDEINSLILNHYIYNNEEYMKRYKEVLYKYLFNYLECFRFV